MQAVNLYTGSNTTNDGPYGVTVNYPGPPADINILAMGFGGDVTLQDGFVDRNTAFLVTPTKFITGPNNLYNNFYQSQINYPGPYLNTFGPHGTSNHIALSTIPVSGARQGTDISTVSLKNYLNRAVTGLAMDITGSVDNLVVVGSGYSSNVAQPIITVQKSSNKSIVAVGDVITYTSVITNAISDSNNAIFLDTLPSELGFITGTVYVNGVANPLANPTLGINLGNIPINTTRTVSFDVRVVSVNSTLSIPNTSKLTYGFTVSGSAFTSEKDSNVVMVNYILNSATKKVDKSYAKLGDEIIYTIEIGNYDETSLDNMVLYDTLPFGIDFINESLSLNGTVLGGQNPSLGVNLGNLSSNSINTIIFRGKVNTIPANNKIDNTATIEFMKGTIPDYLNTNLVTTTITSANLKIEKYSDNMNYGLGDTITYTFKITNSGNVQAGSITFLDTIESETTFISNSFMENGIMNSQNPTMMPGASIGNIGGNQTTTLVFKVKVTSVPNNNPIKNVSGLSYNYIFGTTIVVSDSIVSNTIDVNINAVNFSGLMKSVDKSYARPGEILTYVITIPNTGTIDAKSSKFYDTIPIGTTFIQDSVKVDGVQTTENPELGIDLGSIPRTTIKVIEFKVQVN